MALTGIQIFKFLPKTNCKDCGAATCLAFAMNLAAGKASLDQCPHLTPEAREELAAASAPPIRKIDLGFAGHVYGTGDETVLFRHEKTFNHQPLLAAELHDNDSNLLAKIKQWQQLQWPRIGLNLRPEMVFIKNSSRNAQLFLDAANNVLQHSDFILALQAVPEIMEQVLPELADKRPLLYAADAENCQVMGKLALEHKCPLVVKGKDIEEIIQLTEQMKQQGLQDMILDCGAASLAELYNNNIIMRRSAILDKNQALGYPIINFANIAGPCMARQTMAASAMIAKYAGIIVLDDFRPESLFPLLLLRLNIYTDPQRPMTMGQGIYPVANPGPDSPVVVTTNFSLTYFMVNGEIENSRVPIWLLIMDTEGLSVLTAWAAGKFVGDTIGDFIKKSGIIEKINHHRLIIPGYVANIKAELEEALPGWQIISGPREVSALPKFLKNISF